MISLLIHLFEVSMANEVDAERNISLSIVQEKIQQHLVVNSDFGTGDDYYETTNKHRGIALLLNHSKFKNKPVRLGTEHDCNRLEKVLKKFSFHVHIENDLSEKQIREKLRYLASIDHSDSDCLVVVVMTHGKKDSLYASNSSYAVKELWEPFVGDKCPTLVGKPKLFFIQACRGTKIDKGIVPQLAAFSVAEEVKSEVPDDSSFYRIPSMADFLVMYATFEDHVSWRNAATGSWFIQSLAHELDLHGAQLDLMFLLTRVTRRVATIYESNNPKNKNMDQAKQIPTTISTLTKLLYFTPKL